MVGAEYVPIYIITFMLSWFGDNIFNIGFIMVINTTVHI